MTFLLTSPAILIFCLGTTLLIHNSPVSVSYIKRRYFAMESQFKKQNCLHIQQIFYQGQERFQSSSPKSSHVQQIFF